jgi:beta-mannosidase
MIKVKTVFYSILLSGIFFCCNAQKANVSNVSNLSINKGWQYKKADTQSWSNASVPGCIQTDLLNDKKIQDPFYRLNEKDQQWIGESDWEYKTVFTVTKEMFKEQNLSLIFEGLDTYADVYLNEQKIVSCNNMFRTWDIDVKSKLKLGENSLRVYFHNVFKINKPKYDNAEYKLQAFRNNDQADVKLSLYSRKAGFHYGWDWGPRFVTSGIWRPVTLKGWSDFKTDNVYFRQSKVTAKKAEISVEYTISSTNQTTVELAIVNEKKTFANQKVVLKPGVNKIKIPIVVNNPKLWWTNGLGEPSLYAFSTTIKSKNGAVEKRSNRIGIRSLEVVRDNDKFGKSLYLKLNGVPIFIKGANYIPQDNFQNRVTKERYNHIIGSAKAANMNMLRVWGGGIYEEDIFYNLCDENGLLVWQDIMFACGMFPSDDLFLENVKNEVIDNVTRLRNHPSVALYCGNNENEIAWHSWGWKELYDSETQKKYEADLKKLFYEAIPQAISSADPDRYYHPSSPIAGIGEKRPKEVGDTHYWGVWHGKEPFKNFEKNVSRFVSEYGFQSYPEFSSIKKFSIEEDWHLESDVMHSHQRCMADEGKDIDYGNKLIQGYLDSNFNKPKDFENYVYVVQALQAKGVKMAVETHRRNRKDNYCMGTMYWQIDDCWPVASWSSIDYYGKWKALHYQVKKAYSQVLATHFENDNNLGVFIVSDELKAISNADLNVQVYDFKGNKLWSKSQKVTIAPNTSKEYVSIKIDEALNKVDKQSAYVITTVKLGDKVFSENRYFFDDDKNLKLPKANIKYTSKKVANGYEITLNTDSLAKYVLIELANDEAFISDNYFDLDANTSKTITIETKADLGNINNLLKINSLIDSYQ